MRVLLISTYEMGRQPFGLASPAAWLRGSGAEVRTLDLACCKLDPEAVRAADLIAFYLPMHTATRIAVPAIEHVRRLQPRAHLCAFGLYAPVNAQLLRFLGVSTVLGGEFEQPLLALYRRLAAGETANGAQAAPLVSLARQQFLVPDRAGLPELKSYARLRLPDGGERLVGYTEASRGCKHLCRHCPIVPVYNGSFRVVQREVVLADIRNQVAAGAQHITFGDPDFFNGITHALELVRSLHREFPHLTYDVTIKVEHLLRYAEHLPLLRQTGCAFVTTAVESLDDRVLMRLDKGHTRADFLAVAALFRQAELALAPTFVAFHPWTTLESYRDLLATTAELGLIDNVAPVQWAIRLLVPAGSRLLDLEDFRALLGDFDPQALSYRWQHRDVRVDRLQRSVEAAVQQRTAAGASRAQIFTEVWRLLHQELRGDAANLEGHAMPLPQVPPGQVRATIPYLTEPWFC